MLSHGARTGRRAARLFLAELGFDDGALTDAELTISAALRSLNLDAVELPEDDPLLAGAVGVLDREVGVIWFRACLTAETRSFLLAHEIAHWRMHGDASVFADADSGVGALGYDAMGEVEGYSPVQRSEIEASSFAAELIASADAVVAAFSTGMSAQEIAKTVCVHEDVIVRQLVMHVLEDVSEIDVSCGETGFMLDDDQRAAAQASDRTTLVVAGPGSGKTAALVGRAVHLLQKGVAPERILALTFSRNAAEEMRDRLSQLAGSRGRGVQVFTAHAYGLELLRVYGRRLGLPPNPTVITPDRALGLLENALADCEPCEMLCVESPASPLAEVVRLIARWKGARKTPEDLKQTPDAPPSFLEAVTLYRWYQGALSAGGMLDYSDLITRAVDLLRWHDDVRAHVQGSVDHVLVDEVQDFDAEAIELIRLLHGAQVMLWLVGDPCQAIYSFRGSNQGLIATDGAPQPDRVVTLDASYRSSAVIVRVLAEFASRAGLHTASGLKGASDVADGGVVFAVAEDEHCQADGIAESVRRNAERGMPFCRQAVLCRTHAQASRIAAALRRRRLPVRSVEAVLANAAARHAVLALARTAGVGELTPCPDIDPPSVCDGDLETLEGLLGRYCFGKCGVARGMKDDLAGRRALAWLYWFIADREHELVTSRRAGLTERARSIIADLRRTIALKEDRQVADWGDTVGGALNVMTVHAAKGLEFDAVFVPNLNAGYFPPRVPPTYVQLPASDSAEDFDAIWQAEARLLYVAMSRARRCLTVSLCQRLGGRSVEASELAEVVRAAMVVAGGRAVEWGCTEPNGVSVQNPPLRVADDRRWHLGDLDAYDQCPRRYCLTRKTESKTVDSGYTSYCRAMYAAVRASRQADAAGQSTADAAMAAWKRAWADAEVGQPYGHVYERLAAEAIGRIADDPDVLQASEATFEVHCDDLTVEAHADGVRLASDGAIEVETYRFLRRPVAHRAWPAATILRMGAEAQWPGREVRVGTRYILSGDVASCHMTKGRDAFAVTKYTGIVRDILASRYPPKPNDWCAYCPFVFACPRSSDDA